MRAELNANCCKTQCDLSRVRSRVTFIRFQMGDTLERAKDPSLDTRARGPSLKGRARVNVTDNVAVYTLVPHRIPVSPK